MPSAVFAAAPHSFPAPPVSPNLKIMHRGLLRSLNSLGAASTREIDEETAEDTDTSLFDYNNSTEMLTYVSKRMLTIF